MRLVGHPEVIDEPWFASGHGRVQHVDELDEYVGSWIAARTREQVIDAFTEAGAAVAGVYDARDVTEDPHIRATEMLTEVPSLTPIADMAPDGRSLPGDSVMGFGRPPFRRQHAESLPESFDDAQGNSHPIRVRNASSFARSAATKATM